MCEQNNRVITSLVSEAMMEDLAPQEWAEEYDLLHKNPPEEGDFLTTQDGSPIKVEIELIRDREPLVFARMFLPMTVGARLGWFCRSMNDLDCHGWKCILMRHSKEELINRYGLGQRYIGVSCLRIIRKARTGQSYLVDISEF